MEDKASIEAAMVKVYGEGVRLLTQEVGQGIVQVGVVHAAGIPLLLATATSEEVALKAVKAAMDVVTANTPTS
jgi:hypothetical protein